MCILLIQTVCGICVYSSYTYIPHAVCIYLNFIWYLCVCIICSYLLKILYVTKFY